MLTYHLYTLSKPVSPDLLGGTLPSGSAGIGVCVFVGKVIAFS